MPTPEEFRAAFAGDGLATFPAAAVSSLPITAADVNWLINVGLPRSTAPFLSFGSKYEINVPTAADLWRISDGSHYRVIGSNGSGDPVVIDTECVGEVVYLNHDNDFRREFISSTVLKLADALLAYHRLIEEAQAANGPDAYLEGNVPPASLHRFASLMALLDPPTMRGGMWLEELEQLDRRAATG